MKDLVNQMFSGAFGSMRRKIQAREYGRRETARVSEVLERVVEGVDPTIRFVPGYQKKLHDAIAASLDYTEQLVAEIPGAIGVSRRTFVADPYVNAFFVNVKDLQTVFSHSSEIREFMDDYRSGEFPDCYALLCMHKSEKTILGVELEGDVLRHDVRQTAVSFSDHRIYSPATTEAETRQGLKHCFFEGLGSNALGRIMSMKLANHRLQQERQVLNARLRRLHQQTGDAGEHTPTDAILAGEMEEISEKLSKVEQALLNSRLVAPEESLNQVNAVFKRPDEFIQVRKTALKLNKMGIKIDDQSSQPCNRIQLTEVVIGEEAPRVVTLAKFPRDELLPPTEFLAHTSFS